MDDFGERIEGARKHGGYAERYRAALAQPRGDTLADLWPLPNWEKLIADGVDTKAVCAARAVREAVRPRPKRPYNAQRWRDSVEALVALAGRLLAGEGDPLASVKDLSVSARPAFARAVRLREKALLYAYLGQGRSLKPFDVSLSRVSGTWSIARKHEVLAEDARLDRAAEKLEAHLDQAATGPREPKIEIRQYRSRPGLYFLAARGGQKGTGGNGDGYILLKRFTSLREALDYRRENRRELAEKVRRLRRLPAKHAPGDGRRTGPERRSGDVTRELFEDTFQPRGVQFGDTIPDAERRMLLNRAFDGLMDLADTLGVDPPALFFNERLGLALGARGRGGPPAGHFEPGGNPVINLTRTRGAGALCHEWFHAFDHFAGRLAEVRGDDVFLSEAAVAGTVPLPARADARVRRAARTEKLFKTAFGPQAPITRRAWLLDGYRSKRYWSRPHEMAARAFESCVADALDRDGRQSPFLVSLNDPALWRVWAAAAGVAYEEAYPYLNAEECAAYREGLFALTRDWLEALNTPPAPKAEGVAEAAAEATPYG